jgi:hypothetical protein
MTGIDRRSACAQPMTLKSTAVTQVENGKNCIWFKTSLLEKKGLKLSVEGRLRGPQPTLVLVLLVLLPPSP